MLAVSDITLRLAEGRSIWLLMLAVVAGVALVVYSYRVSFTQRSPAANDGRAIKAQTVILLMLLRITVVIILVFSIFRPVLSFERRTAPRSAIAVVVDRSRSMAEFDYEGLPNRMGRAVDALLGSQGALAELEDDFVTRSFVFDEAATRLEAPDGLFNEKPTGVATNLIAGVRGAIESCRAERIDLAGAIVLSDGIQAVAKSHDPASPEADHGDAEDPAQALGALGVPIYAVGVGEARLAEGTFKDIRLSSVRAPAVAPVKSVARIRVMVEAQGYGGRVVQVRIFEENAECARGDVTLDDAGGDQEVVLSLTPTETGQHEYRAEVMIDSAENIRWNNSRAFFLNVTDPRVRVLYLEGAVRPEFRFLRRLLERDHMVEPVCLIKVKTGVFRRLGDTGEAGITDFPRTRAELEPYDVFLIGDLDATHFSEGQLVDVAREVRENGKGLLLTQGAAAFGAGGYGNTALAAVLPVRLASREEPVESGTFHMRLTAEGKAHPIMRGCVEYFAGAASKGIPPFQVINRVELASGPGAVLLAGKDGGEEGAEMAPVVVTGRHGSGRTLVVTAGPTWQWSFDNRSGAPSGASAYARFWAQAVRYLAGEEDQKASAGVSVRLDRGEAIYGRGEAVTVYAQARGAGGELTPFAEVVAGMQSASDTKDAQSIKLSPSPGRPGEYEATFTPSLTGRYEISVSAKTSGEAGGRDLGSASIKLEVEAPSVENERFDIDEDCLRAISEVSGGRYVPIAQLRELTEFLRARQSERRHAVTIRFWNPPLFFLLLVVAAGIEWYMRRRLQMA